jgi:NADPH:quinone reductase-like Zn-dependent oxidoreductase
MLTPKEHASVLKRLTEFIEAGQVTASIDRTYPLERVPEAVRHLRAGRARGKIAITN